MEVHREREDWPRRSSTQVFSAPGYGSVKYTHVQVAFVPPHTYLPLNVSRLHYLLQANQKENGHNTHMLLRNGHCAVKVFVSAPVNQSLDSRTGRALDHWHIDSQGWLESGNVSADNGAILGSQAQNQAARASRICGCPSRSIHAHRSNTTLRFLPQSTKLIVDKPKIKCIRIPI